MVMARDLAAPEKLQNRGVLVGWEAEPGRCTRPLGGTVRLQAPGRKLGGRSVASNGSQRWGCPGTPLLVPVPNN